MNITIRLPSWAWFADGCKRKVRYGHKKTALEAIVAMERKGVCGLEPYHCKNCNGWHVGHPVREKP